MPKLTINVSDEVHAGLKDAASTRGVTVTELFRRSFALYKFLTEDPNATILLKKGSDIQEVVFLP